MGDLFLDMPPEQSQVQMEMAGIVPEYFLTIPYEPGKKGLKQARQTLGRYVGFQNSDDS